MARISTYSLDEKVTGGDKWIGSDSGFYNKTKNFTPLKLADYFNSSEKIDSSNSLRFWYQTLDFQEDRSFGTISFENEIGSSVSFSSITSFLLSKRTEGNIFVYDFLDSLIDSKVLLHQGNTMNIYSIYEVTNIEEYELDSNFIKVDVSFIRGNGGLIEDLSYLLSVVDFALEASLNWGNIEGNLSDQTDLQEALYLKANNSDLGAVAFSNDYNDLDNLPTIPNNLEELHNVTETNYTTPIDTDSVLTFDVNNSLWKRLSWANIKSNLKTYFDTIYQTALGFTPENVANKSTNLESPNDTNYPTTQAVSTALNSKLDKSTTPSSVYGTDASGEQTMIPLNEIGKDILEFSDLASFPATGETEKIYIALDTNLQYRWSGSAYVQIGGGKTKYIIYKNFLINPMSNFTDWYRQISDIASYTPNAGITDTNAFSADQNRFPQQPIPFAFKIKNINVNLESNAGGVLSFDFTIRSFELPFGQVNSGLTTNSTNNIIVGRKLVQQLHGGSQPNYSFTGTEIDTTTTLSANSHLKLYIKNNSGVSAGSVQGMVAITIEEI